jgi:hypothetical protein
MGRRPGVRTARTRDLRRRCEQLTLIEPSECRRSNGWRLDEHTRRTGLRGVEAARERLTADGGAPRRRTNT